MKIGIIFASHYFNYATFNKSYMSWGYIVNVQSFHKSPVYFHLVVYWMK